jgi:hypothetical protein
MFGEGTGKKESSFIQQSESINNPINRVFVQTSVKMKSRLKMRSRLMRIAQKDEDEEEEKENDDDETVEDESKGEGENVAGESGEAIQEDVDQNNVKIDLTGILHMINGESIKNPKDK